MSAEKIETARMGRKPVEKEVRRIERLTIPLNEQESKILVDAASAAGIPKAIWARNILLAAARKK